MRILITGSQGILAGPLRRQLEMKGHDVYGCDLKHSDDPKEIRADVSEPNQLARAVEKSEPDVIYHLAAEFGRINGHEYPEQLWRTNCLGTRHVIDACVRHKAKLVFASSSEAYGELPEPSGMPEIRLPESFTVPLNENDLDRIAPSFHNEYALTKWTNERQINIAANNRGLKAVILRFFNAYGPGETYSPYRSVVCLFCYRLMKGLPITVYKNYHRVFMYVDDWARTVARVADAYIPSEDSTRPELLRRVPVFNVGGKEYCSVEELKDKIVKMLDGSDSKIAYLGKDKDANVTNKQPDISLAEKVLGHDPSITLDEGLPLTIAWLRKKYGAPSRVSV